MDPYTYDSLVIGDMQDLSKLILKMIPLHDASKRFQT